jgi:hypothetical protein
MQDQWAIMLLSLFAVAATIYLIVRSVFDWRARNLRWAVVGTVIAALGVVTMFVPVKTHAVKIDLPRN